MTLREPPTRAKGHKPIYFDEPAIDHLHAAVLALAGELAVALDRIDSLERLLAQAGTLPADAVDRFKPDAEASRARAARHTQVAEAILKPFRDYREALIERATHAAAPSANTPPSTPAK
jgi:hypothetical protein